eukprot:scaffold5087_cov430-Prasinococcus_capsulatus_cf.AAC.5
MPCAPHALLFGAAADGMPSSARLDTGFGGYERRRVVGKQAQACVQGWGGLPTWVLRLSSLACVGMPQVENIVALLDRMVGRNQTLVDFAGGTGHIAVVLALRYRALVR